MSVGFKRFNSLLSSPPVMRSTFAPQETHPKNSYSPHFKILGPPNETLEQGAAKGDVRYQKVFTKLLFEAE